MAKCLGGVTDPNIRDIEIYSPGLFVWGFMLSYLGKDGDGCINIADSIVRYEEIRSESHKDFSLTWGALGYMAAGELAGIIGAVLGGGRKENHVVLCELNNGWRVMLQLDRNEFKSWRRIMDPCL